MRHSVVYDPAPIPGRLSEDSYFFHEDDDQIVMMVADGATPRATLTAAGSLYQMMGANINAASYASRLVRETVAAHVDESPRAILLRANDRLRMALESVYGELTAGAFLTLEPQLSWLRHDPRLIRLALPVAVATIVRVDLKARRLEFAHAGDCALFAVTSEGDILPLTDDQMGQHDDAALGVARAVQAESGLAHLSDALADERVTEANRRNGLYHNYVDERGQIDQRVGGGVVDGLPQLEAYLQTGTVDIINLSHLFLASDGAIPPAAPGETPAQVQTRLQHMWRLIEQRGISGYADELRRVEASDPTLDRYPRFKRHDDATAMVVEFHVT
jgi:serine/threonine protein phosphatase PrpC